MRAMSRFAEPPDPAFRRLNDSLSYDQRLWPYDVQQSRAHVRMLAAQEIISTGDRDALLEALDQVQREFEQGTFPFQAQDEDIHMAIERRVTELAPGPAESSTPRGRATIRWPRTWPCSSGPRQSRPAAG